MSQYLSQCPLCDANSFSNLYDAEDRQYGIPGRFPVVRCDSCSLVFLNPTYSDAELAGMYPNDYYAYQDKFEVRVWRDRWKKTLGYHLGTKDPVFAQPGVCLDVGCGTGWWLDRMRSKGWKVFGVEISERAARLGRETKHLEIFAGTLQDAGFAAGSFDFVHANHAFEHISCPDATLQTIRDILRPNGKLLIAVPNIASVNGRFFGQYWWHLCAPVHVFSYSVSTLTRLLQKHDFRVEKVTFHSDFFGVLGSYDDGATA